MPKKTISGHIVNANGDPVAGAEVAPFWQAEDNHMKPYWGVCADISGHFTLELEWYDQAAPLLAIDPEQQEGGCNILDAETVDSPVSIKLQPLVRIQGSFSCAELGERPEWVMIYAHLPGKLRIAGCSTTTAEFFLKLPPGDYELDMYGEHYQNPILPVTLAAGPPVLDLGTVDMAATTLSRLYGKEPPPWNITAARGISPDVSLADFRGQWVILEFWAYW